MENLPSKRPHILFLFSDTGGGHRSAAEAITEALHLDYGDRLSTEMLDFLKASPDPFRRMPTLYPYMVRAPHIWGLGYRLSNGRRRTHVMVGTMWPIVRKIIREMIANHPSNLIVSVHPLINGPLLRAMGKDRPPFTTVVTDLATTHAFWYHPQTDLCLVPTEEAYRRAIKWKVPMERVHITGLPVGDRFCQPTADRATLRSQLGWPKDLPMTVLVGGGDGMGPLGLTAEAIAASGIHTGLAIVTGRNQKLKERLEAHKWPLPTFIYGFVRNMPDFMGAADVLVTKAGPGTVTEALNAGLPMILYSKLPGQEDGNVTFITEKGAGIWAPKPQQIVSALAGWIEDPEKRAQAALTCRQLARPQASHNIAHFLAGQVGLSA